MFVLVGVYPTKSAAEADQKTVKKLHASDLTGKFETTVITRDEHGQVHVANRESNARTWAAEGLVSPRAPVRSPSLDHHGRRLRWAGSQQGSVRGWASHLR